MLQRAYALSASLNKRDSACSLPVAFIHSLCQHEKTRLSKVKCFRGTVAHVESQSNVTYDRQRRGMKSLLRGDHAFPCPRKRIFRQTYIDTMSRCFDSLCHVFSDIVRTAGISLSVALGIFSKDCVSSDHRFVACVVRFVSVIFLPMKKKKKKRYRLLNVQFVDEYFHTKRYYFHRFIVYFPLVLQSLPFDLSTIS